MKIVGRVNIFLTKTFEKLAKNVVKYNTWFLITPIFLTAFLTTGIQKIKIAISEDYFVPNGGVTGTHKSRLKALYPLDISKEFDPGRLFDLSFYGTVTIQATDNRSVLRQTVFKEMLNLDQVIRNFIIIDENPLSYEEICARKEGKCFENKILLLKTHIEEIENRTLLLKYPVEENNQDHGVLSLGGVIVDKNDFIISAQAITLFYFLDNTGKRKEDIARKWEDLFVEKINELKFKNINIEKDISISRDRAVYDLFFIAMKYVPPSSVIMILFTVLSGLFPDFLRSKPWMGIVSVTTTGMSLLSGLGLLSYIGLVMTASVILVPFLVLGIGMDDTFIMLSAWMRIDPKKSIEERISETYKESGVSITITSLTNIGCFSAGYFFSALPILKNFCIDMVCCLTFDYIYQITFIGAFLVIFGKAEERRLHSVVFIPLEHTSSLGRKQIFRRMFCYVKPDTTNEDDKKPLFSVSNFWMKFSKQMTKTNIRIFIMFLYSIYLSITIWGLTKYFLDATLDINMIKGSSRDNYYKLQQKFYHQYQYRLQLFIDQKLDYADPQVQTKIEKFIQHLESDPLIAHSNLTGWWLRSYLKFLSDKRSSLFLSGFNLTDPFDFFYVFRHYFLKIPLAKQFRHDIVFDKNYTSIVSCRFFLQTNITRDNNHFYSQLTNFKKKLDAAPYSVILYHPLFYYFEVIDLIPELCRQTFSIVIITVIIISAILLPSILTILCIIFSIFSVTAGIMGFMFLCGIGLNLHAVSFFTASIGICVDYAAHISCAYDSVVETDPNKRLINAVTLTSMPILQGASTTVFAIILCLLIPSKDVITGTKIICLVCFIAAAHSILFLPVVISLLDSFRQRFFICKSCSQNNNFVLGTEENNTAEKGVENIAMNHIL